MTEHIEAYERLRIANVKKAADDYRRALIVLRRRPKDTKALCMKDDCERFFRQDIGLYSDLDGETLMRGIQERVRREYG